VREKGGLDNSMAIGVYGRLYREKSTIFRRIGDLIGGRKSREGGKMKAPVVPMVEILGYKASSSLQRLAEGDRKTRVVRRLLQKGGKAIGAPEIVQDA